MMRILFHFRIMVLLFILPLTVGAQTNGLRKYKRNEFSFKSTVMSCLVLL